MSQNATIRVVVHGAGRMARMVLAQMPAFSNYERVGLVSRTRPVDLPAVDWFASLDECPAAADLLIDFTLPGGTRSAAQWCAHHGVAMLSGTTGLADEDQVALQQAAQHVPVLWAANLSFGVALMSSLVRQAATALGESTEISIHDIHHKHKLDAPSGTALALGKAAGEGDVAYTSDREGEVIGEHTVSFRMRDETIEISHKALEREVFARGALQAGEWLVRQKPGFYSTADWLGLGL